MRTPRPLWDDGVNPFLSTDTLSRPPVLLLATGQCPIVTFRLGHQTRSFVSCSGTCTACRKGDDEDDYMRAKPSQGKKLAFGFLSRVGNKDKYAKRLDKLKQGVLQGNSDLNGSLQHGEACSPADGASRASVVLSTAEF